ncbi:MAG: site-specific DNA-methyltransferase [Gammaproteobacteria bacterium]|nr:site-specific DNA-methyltransferase [Gammaproteobacteria bacterium]
MDNYELLQDDYRKRMDANYNPKLEQEHGAELEFVQEKMDRFKLHQGDSLKVLKQYPDNYFDSIATDPPYGLSFMGKKWDYDVPSQDIFEECLRVLKPGGHMVSFAGSRTYHRMAVRVEDAGFEIRDQIMWVYGVGFPKSHNVNKAYAKKSYKETKHRVRQMLETHIQKTERATEEQREVLLGYVLERKLPKSLSADQQRKESKEGTQGVIKSVLEGWQKSETLLELQECLCSLSRAFEGDGTKGWLHSGTSYGDGTLHWQASNEDRSGSSHRPQSFEQLYTQLDAIFNEWRAQEMGGGKSLQSTMYNGIGTSIKPAHEPIVLARKPLSEDTIVDNVIKWGTGGINIDECRVGNEPIKSNGYGSGQGGKSENGILNPYDPNHKPTVNEGRFPANFIHDGSDEVLEQFPNSKGFSGGGGPTRFANAEGGEKLDSYNYYGDQGSAARFFYTAKVSKTERNAGCEEFDEKIIQSQNKIDKTITAFAAKTSPRKNIHPTVKPIDLMAYLIKLITPINGTILDPFMGSGSTGCAAATLEHFKFVGIDLDQSHVDIAEARIAYWRDPKKREIYFAELARVEEALKEPERGDQLNLF